MQHENTKRLPKLRIGLLLCDGFGYAPMFARGLGEVDAALELIPWQCYAGEIPQSPQDFDGYILSGSRKSTYDNLPWMLSLAEFVRDCVALKKHTVGICFGHQFLAHALGGKSGKAAAGWGIGVQQIEIIATKEWMDADADAVQLIVMHQDQVTQPPPDTEIIAKNDFCAVGMFANDVILGIQGHPEFSIEFCESRIHERREILGEGVFDKALDSLQNPQLDSAKVLSWIARFLRNN